LLSVVCLSVCTHLFTSTSHVIASFCHHTRCASPLLSIPISQCGPET
jgi:hypothetical protein